MHRAFAHPTRRPSSPASSCTAGVIANIDGIAAANIGTLFAFVLVCIGVTVLRFREPTRERPFRVPLGPFLFPTLGVISCIFLMMYLPPASWWRFVGWLVLGMSIYFAFSYNHSTVGRLRYGRPEAPTGMQARGGGVGISSRGRGAVHHSAQAGPGELIALASAADPRASTGLSMIALGVIASALGGVRMGAGPKRV
jgi:APA family basic amino acid/polyamine antiporter